MSALRADTGGKLFIRSDCDSVCDAAHLAFTDIIRQLRLCRDCERSLVHHLIIPGRQRREIPKLERLQVWIAAS